MEPIAPDSSNPAWPDYALLDSGGGAKLERFGPHTILREELLARHPRTLPPAEWGNADAHYIKEEGWHLRPGTPDSWPVQFGPLTLKVRPAPGFKHVGLFPEQAPQWQWLLKADIPETPQPPRLLNLFGHTGAATLAAAHAGYAVTHVDASRPAIQHARENQQLCGLADAPVRWIHEDATQFVHREHKRDKRYHGILLDPPAFGRGPKGQTWHIGKDLPALLPRLLPLLEPSFHFLFLNLYAGDLSTKALQPLIESHGHLHHGTFELPAQNGPRLHMAEWLQLGPA